MNKTLSAFLLLLVLVPAAFAQAVPTDQQVSQAKTDVSAFVSQWQAAHPKDAVTTRNLLQYVLSEHSKNKPTYASFGNTGYQPLYLLPGGGWVMGFNDFPTGIAVLTDVNTGLTATQRKSSAASGTKIFVLDKSGQVTQVLN